MGFTVKLEKSVTIPTQSLVPLKLRIYTVEMAIHIPVSTLLTIREASTEVEDQVFLHTPNSPNHSGLPHQTRGYSHSPLHYRGLQGVAADLLRRNPSNYNHAISLQHEEIEDL
ncbi:hypothetical protein LOD99_3161 [Oopsacas minuta]|uniref:Uncharacterized protein n=1 Tax=Oopsacas minuta TaxID=111878 RepID=A0AAV7JYW8_9METZ|nr:hypothetical protein LOD99_3161 [Oopsacas minuta]